jgi:hypothetical protein
MGLPSGQTVARAMGLEPLADEQLVVGKATAQDHGKNPSIVSFDTANGSFVGQAPLWFYILAEAQSQFIKDDTPIRLGPVGGRIVAETFVGLLLGDAFSFLSQDPGWSPNATRDFKMRDLLRLAIS